MVLLILLEDAGKKRLNVNEAALGMYTLYCKGSGKPHVPLISLWKAEACGKLQDLVM